MVTRFVICLFCCFDRSLHCWLDIDVVYVVCFVEFACFDLLVAVFLDVVLCLVIIVLGCFDYLTELFVWSLFVVGTCCHLLFTFVVFCDCGLVDIDCVGWFIV